MSNVTEINVRSHFPHCLHRCWVAARVQLWLHGPIGRRAVLGRVLLFPFERLFISGIAENLHGRRDEFLARFLQFLKRSVLAVMAGRSRLHFFLRDSNWTSEGERARERACSQVSSTKSLCSSKNSIYPTVLYMCFLGVCDAVGIGTEMEPYRFKHSFRPLCARAIFLLSCFTNPESSKQRHFTFDVCNFFRSLNDNKACPCTKCI